MIRPPSLMVVVACVVGGVTVTAVAFLAWVGWLANASDLYVTVAVEGRRVAQSSLAVATVAGAVLVILLVAGTLLGARTAYVAAAALAGGAVATLTAAAPTLAIAWAIAPWTDPRDTGRVVFPIGYTGALVIALVLAVATALCIVRRGRHAMIAAAGAIAVTVAMWGYLATGSSEFNQCMVDDPFPLIGRDVRNGGSFPFKKLDFHGCSGQ